MSSRDHFLTWVAPRPNAVIGGLLIAIVVSMALTALFWTPYDPLKLQLSHRLEAPQLAFPLGTDQFGRDVLSRLMAGASASLWIALLTVIVALTLGVTLGLIAGYMRGLIDRLLMIVSDAILAFPGILMAMGLMVIIGASQYGIIAALGLAYTPPVLRVVRGTVMSVREREYVEFSQVVGNSEMVTMVRHVLPNCIAPIVVLTTSMFGWVILSESALSFLGLGVPPPAPTWGNMLADSRPYIESAPWLGIAPGLCITLALLGINLLGDALRDHLDPWMEL